MAELRLELLGQASVALRVGDVEIVSDPWVVGKAQLGAWAPYPPRSAREIVEQRARVDRASHIYVSHDHSDHFDPELLAQLKPKQLLVASFHNRRLRDALEVLTRQFGHEVIALAPGQELALGSGTTVRIIPEQPRFRTNSMLLVNTPVGAVLNANDCGLNGAVLTGIAQRYRVRVFLYTLNFMANGYPFPYLSSHDPDLLSRLSEVRDQVVGSFQSAMRALRPELSVAFAGPVTFPDPANRHLNRHPEALDWRKMVKELAREGAIIWPAPSTRLTLTADTIQVEDAKTWDELLTEHQPAATTAPDSAQTLDRTELESSARIFLDRVGGALERTHVKVGITLALSAVPSRQALEDPAILGTLALGLDPPRSLRWIDEAAPPYLQILSTPDLLNAFLRGQVTLDELLLSAYARFRRDPDVFHGALHNFLRFGHDPDALEELLRWLSPHPRSRATIERRVGAKVYHLPKFCPHEGESLEHAEVASGRIVCPRHKWCFDVDTGACVAVGDPSINLYQNVRDRG